MQHDPRAIPRDASGRFLGGGPGRPLGARNRVSRRVANMIMADFAAHREDVLPRLRRWFLPQYASLIGRLMLRGGEAEADEGEALPDAEAARLIAAARAALARIDAGEGTLADLEAALAGEGAADDAETGAGLADVETAAENAAERAVSGRR